MNGNATKFSINNATELTSFIHGALPHMQETGLSRHLRKIKTDPNGKGKSVIIWWGCPSMQDRTELRVTVGLGVRNLTNPLDTELEVSTSELLKKKLSEKNRRIEGAIKAKETKLAIAAKKAAAAQKRIATIAAKKAAAEAAALVAEPVHEVVAPVEPVTPAEPNAETVAAEHVA